MKRIQIHRGVIIVDDDVSEWFDWTCVYLNKAGYPSYKIGKKKYCIHKMVLPKTPKGMVVDHINRNKLDNRRENLRFLTPRENFLNSDWHEEQSLKKEDTDGKR